jgi:hypothetical protein
MDDFNFRLIPQPKHIPVLHHFVPHSPIDERLLTLHIVEAFGLLYPRCDAPEHEIESTWKTILAIKQDGLHINVNRSWSPGNVGYNYYHDWLTTDPRTVADSYGLTLKHSRKNQDVTYNLNITVYYSDSDKAALEAAGVLKTEQYTYETSNLVCTL